MINEEALRQAAEAATPGPWVARHQADPWFSLGSDVIAEKEDGTTTNVAVDNDRSEGWGACKPADAAYIAAADPQTILNLLAELRGHREAEQRVRELCGSLLDETIELDARSQRADLSSVATSRYLALSDARKSSATRVLAALDGTRGDG